MQITMQVTLYHDCRRALSDGTFPVKIRVTYFEGKWKQNYFPTGQSCSKQDWDKIKSGSVRGELRNTYMEVNKRLSQVQDAANTCTSFSELRSQLNGGHRSGSFFDFAVSELQKEKGVLKPKTFVGYMNRLINLKKRFGDFDISAVTHPFLVDMRTSLLKSRKLNGIYQDFACVKKFYRKAVVHGKASGNPFSSFKLKKEATTKEWLTKEELRLLFDLLGTNKITEAKKNTLRHFLFACFTGLRFSDKRLFAQTDIQEDNIVMKTQKTGKQIVVPFHHESKQLLPFVLTTKLKQSNSRVNSDIDFCIKAAFINKTITFHSSRHTFAINCLLAGIDIVTVRDWLGHTSVTTTEIYAKIAAQYKNKSMEKLENYFAV